MSNSRAEQNLITFIRNNKERFYYLAYSYTKNEQDALDVVQDSIQKALQSLHTLQNEDQMRSWFYKIVVRTAIDFLRKHKRQQVMEDDKLVHLTPQQIDTYENTDLEIALDNLPTVYREVVILRYFEDLKIEDVARVLDTNISTIKSRLYKALKLLRIQLQEEEGL
ncbi:MULTISPECIES: sigma-70 family RNA polymerase sigma factor [Bacillales]|uniref:Sigma-70 family RNA polymerase sigma factor n=1 Tax=Lysinibacillus louembei TaxID=1470088 RepID=A0ABZ0RXN2_9BACI|nr:MULTISPECIES: sigma-70 family RNA polymerase sigma factor [Bacillales]MCT6925969.1 RNA polymerase sigma factor [Metasolibacillus sp.]MCT6942134.1 RNA polymerase sigma factor [Metasolibacillus sp.]WPK12984.1 sigma-70 family RNA polymerase sigma factor [Lysinibacillus louembei]